MKWPFITFHFLFKPLQAINRHGIFSKNSVPFILVCFFVLQTRLTMTTDWFVKFHLLILPFWALKDYFSAFVHLLISTLSSCQKFKRWRWSLFFSHKTESYMHDWSRQTHQGEMHGPYMHSITPRNEFANCLLLWLVLEQF